MKTKGKCSSCGEEFTLKRGKIPKHQVAVMGGDKAKVSCPGGGQLPR